MKRVTLFLILVFFICLTSCSKDAEVNCFISEFDSTTKELISKIDSDPTASGIDNAQKAFNGKKAALKAKWDAIKDALDFQISADTKKKLEGTIKKNMDDLVAVATKHAETIGSDESAGDKFKKLMDDFASMFADAKTK